MKHEYNQVSEWLSPHGTVSVYTSYDIKDRVLKLIPQRMIDFNVSGLTLKYTTFREATVAFEIANRVACCCDLMFYSDSEFCKRIYPPTREVFWKSPEFGKHPLFGREGRREAMKISYKIKAELVTFNDLCDIFDGIG